MAHSPIQPPGNPPHMMCVERALRATALQYVEPGAFAIPSDPSERAALAWNLLDGLAIATTAGTYTSEDAEPLVRFAWLALLNETGRD